MCSFKERAVGYLLSCCRRVAPGAWLGTSISAGCFLGKEVP